MSLEADIIFYWRSSCTRARVLLANRWRELKQSRASWSEDKHRVENTGSRLTDTQLDVVSFIQVCDKTQSGIC